jgi:hypothetical protein
VSQAPSNPSESPRAQRPTVKGVGPFDSPRRSRPATATERTLGGTARSTVLAEPPPQVAPPTAEATRSHGPQTSPLDASSAPRPAPASERSFEGTVRVAQPTESAPEATPSMSQTRRPQTPVSSPLGLLRALRPASSTERRLDGTARPASPVNPASEAEALPTQTARPDTSSPAPGEPARGPMVSQTARAEPITAPSSVAEDRELLPKSEGARAQISGRQVTVRPLDVSPPVTVPVATTRGQTPSQHVTVQPVTTAGTDLNRSARVQMAGQPGHVQPLEPSSPVTHPTHADTSRPRVLAAHPVVIPTADVQDVSRRAVLQPLEPRSPTTMPPRDVQVPARVQGGSHPAPVRGEPTSPVTMPPLDLHVTARVAPTAAVKVTGGVRPETSPQGKSTALVPPPISPPLGVAPPVRAVIPFLEDARGAQAKPATGSVGTRPVSPPPQSVVGGQANAQGRRVRSSPPSSPALSRTRTTLELDEGGGKASDEPLRRTKGGRRDQGMRFTVYDHQDYWDEEADDQDLELPLSSTLRGTKRT